MARPRAADHDDKRAALLDTAASVFATRGFDGASMSDIARALGVSKALIYHYYASLSSTATAARTPNIASRSTISSN
jgi:AcrR family transcriptional regulator